MDKACVIPWQSLMIRADGSIRPCCNSNRTLNSYPNIEDVSIWNTDESVNLRNEMITGKLDNFCKVCKSRNVDPPEDIISKTYTEHAIFCENLPEGNEHVAIVVPFRVSDLQAWKGAYVNFANGRASGSSDRLALVITHPAADNIPDLYFLRGRDNKILASAQGIPVDECKIEVVFENNSLQFQIAGNLLIIAQFMGGECREIAWKSDEEISMSDYTLVVDDQKYPIVSDMMAPLGIVRHFDECIFVGNVLKCKGWAFNQDRDRVPDRFAVFSGNKFIAISSPKGERYDVAKAMSSSKAVESGFSVTVEFGAEFEIRNYTEIQVVALFGKGRNPFGNGRGSLAIACWRRLIWRFWKAISVKAHSSRPTTMAVTPLVWRTDRGWRHFLRDSHYAHLVGTAQARAQPSRVESGAIRTAREI